MNIFLGDLQIDPAAMGKVLGTVAERADLCVKVLDREGVIRAVNDRGLALLQVQKEQFCGRVWTDLWDGTGQERALDAISQGFSGNRASFSGTFRTGDGILRTWVVEVVPLDHSGPDVASLLVISADVTARAIPVDQDLSKKDAIEALIAANKSMLHNLNNVVSSTAGAARILSRNPNADRIDQLSKHLHDCSVRCHEAIGNLQSALDALEGNTNTSN
ncbi:PAS domain-containing protein [Donghicola mangrovi]|uniref:PAS domain-containing protein n=1 Tax=Donghicola mangrovi TaxID=2729614 RepID=A0A850QFB4_9RHOB|nr:PAS domain-containing protein [Donghicola mangrovi]NVO25075.1 PAS domain-containing protein [Donghicola mangrovi]